MKHELTRQRALCVGVLAAGTLAAGITAQAMAGPTWDVDYTEDAGQTALTAQVVTVSLTAYISISGRLSGSGLIGGDDFVDMYQIHVASPTFASISTLGGDLGGSANFDSQLFLFKRKGNSGNVRALGMRGNNDGAPNGQGSRIGDENDPTANYTWLTPGIYYLAITGTGMSAMDIDDNMIWPTLGQPGMTVSGQERVLSDWNGSGATGEYTIRLQTVGSTAPAPGAIALVGLAGLFSRRRR